MNPQDDPEARIRDLERSAAEYGAVELGTSQYGSGSASPPPQLPPPVYPNPYPPTSPYGNPYGAPPMYGAPYAPVPRKGSGAPIALILGLIAVAVVVIFGAVGVVMWNMTASDRITTTRPADDPSVGGSGSPGKSPGSGSPTGLPGIPDAGTVTTAPPGGQLSVAGVDENKTIECNDGSVTVSGVNNTVTITGHCLSVTVSGVENVVAVDSADSIGASGFDNRVTYKSGSPEINATGSNVVEQG